MHTMHCDDRWGVPARRGQQRRCLLQRVLSCVPQCLWRDNESLGRERIKCELQGAALAAAAASPALDGSADGLPPEPPASAMLALTDCIGRACMPALHGPGSPQPFTRHPLVCSAVYAFSMANQIFQIWLCRLSVPCRAASPPWPALQHAPGSELIPR